MNVKKVLLLWLSSAALVVVAVLLIRFSGLGDVRVAVLNKSGGVIDVLTIIPEPNLGKTMTWAGIADGQMRRV